uniref:Transferrin-like domain-containing protein n=1 Tax=Heligmosomoides polygyrus TaxID=6339 RepID=A0A183GWS5_HELPZ
LGSVNIKQILKCFNVDQYVDSYRALLPNVCRNSRFLSPGGSAEGLLGMSTPRAALCQYTECVSVDYAPRLAEIPSQYQLESLSEMFVFDYPKFYKRYSGEELCSLAKSSPVREPVATNPHEVYSQYVSEMLY